MDPYNSFFQSGAWTQLVDILEFFQIEEITIVASISHPDILIQLLFLYFSEMDNWLLVYLCIEG